jgi:hypothetical protein
MSIGLRFMAHTIVFDVNQPFVQQLIICVWEEENTFFYMFLFRKRLNRYLRRQNIKI